MKASPLLIAWHDDNAPVYSVHFDPNGKGRLATAGNDNNVRLWRVESTKEEQRKVVYLSTLVKHTQAVNVVRFSPKGEMLASAGDDGNVLLWVPSELQTQPGLGEDRSDDQETWRVKHMCRSSGAEIYDLAWSPDGVFIITGSMDNIARIYNAQTGQMVRQIAEHSHYVQGVAWDPLNEFVATQSSDRSVHIYSLKTKDGQFTLTSHGKFLKMDLPARRIPSSSPAPEPSRSQPTSASVTVTSPAPSTPGTPKPSTLPMDPPPVSHSRRSSFSSSSIRRSASPAASMPLPAVKPLEAPSPGINTLNALNTLGIKNANLYANETFTSFFRRLSFAPDGSLLFTPAGQYKTMHVSSTDPSRTSDEVINTVYVYTRAGFSKPPISHLPGHKKPSVAIKCSPIFYTLRQAPQPVRHMTLDTSSGEEAFGTLPEPVVGAEGNKSMEPPPSTDTGDSKPQDDAGANITPVFALPYRIVYAVATQDAVMVYDTQQQTPLCVVSNLHFATFTDLTWSNDGLTLIMSSSDGFCSTLTFAPGELGQQYTAPSATSAAATSSTNQTPLPTPTPAPAPTSSASTTTTTQVIPPASPARSTSASSNTTTTPSLSQSTPTTAAAAAAPVINNPTPTLGSVPLVTATNSAQPPGLPLTTPPQTPLSAVPPSSGSGSGSSVSVSVLGKREVSESAQQGRDPAQSRESGSAEAGDGETQPVKKRRVAPTLVSSGDGNGNGSGNGNGPGSG